MTTDRELMELAAKAAGLRFAINEDGLPGYIAVNSDDWRHGWAFWNPLTDDGDALRLAVNLQLSIQNEQVSAGVAYCTRGDGETFPKVRSGSHEADVIDDDYVAARRAILLAAAEIGRSM